MRIELWTDIICPWCGLGSHVLDKALARFGHRRDVELIRRSFVLDESLPEGFTLPVLEVLRSRKGVTDAQARQLTGQVEALAEREGVRPYRVLDNRVGNTLLAHTLAAWATELGRGSEVWHALYRAYWAEALSIFDIDSLVAIATEQGLDAERARVALTSRRYESKIRADGREARELGATGVPFILIDRRSAVRGAWSVDALVQALEAAWRDGGSPRSPVLGERTECGPDGCVVPSVGNDLQSTRVR